MATYWKIGGIYKASAEIASAIFSELMNSETGLTPASLVEASRDKDAPLHNEFEWRDDVAAEAYREVQAATMIRNLVIERESGDGCDRAFVCTYEGENKYVDIVSAFNSEEWRNNLLQHAKGDMNAFKAKYRRLQELSDVITAMDKVEI